MKYKKKTLCYIISVLLIVISFSSILMGCQPEWRATPKGMDRGVYNPPKDHYLSVSELDEWVKSKYFLENGKADRSYWENSAQRYHYYNYEYEEVTDYKITFIKSILEKHTVFLVEFEPSGFVYGIRNLKFYSIFYHHPSPFKILNIPEEDRYYVGDQLAARRGEYIVDIEKEAYVGRVYPVPEDYKPKTYVWDDDTTWWIELNEEE